MYQKVYQCHNKYILFLDEFLQEHHLVLVTRLLPIVREIADTRARNREELEGVKDFMLLV